MITMDDKIYAHRRIWVGQRVPVPADDSRQDNKTTTDDRVAVPTSALTTVKAKAGAVREPNERVGGMPDGGNHDVERVVEQLDSADVQSHRLCQARTAASRCIDGDAARA